MTCHGTAPPQSQLKMGLTPEDWTKEEVDEKRRLLEDMIVRTEDIGIPAKNPWRGVQLEAILPNDIGRLKFKVEEAISRLASLIGLIGNLEILLGWRVDSIYEEVVRFSGIGSQLASAPNMDKRAIADSIWEDGRQDIDELLDAGRVYSSNRSKLESTVSEIGWSSEMLEARRNLAAYGFSLFRIFRKAYRRAIADMRGILVGPFPKKIEERIAILDMLIDGQQARQKIVGMKNVGERAFGSLWRDENSSWEDLYSIVNWENGMRLSVAPPNFRVIASELADIEGVGRLSKNIDHEGSALIKQINGIFEDIRLDLMGAFAIDNLSQIPMGAILERLRAWNQDMDSLTKWIAFYLREREMRQKGLHELVERFCDGRIGPADAMDCFHMAYYEEVIKKLMISHPELAGFDGISHERLLDEFRKLDQRRITMARDEVALAHFKGILSGEAKVKGMDVVRREINKKKRHIPLRQLLKRSGEAIQAVKPLFMMSPMSIAQFLEPGSVEFDILLIDEASQIQPVDALGAVARAKQVVVVGDSKQLPPTRFFSSVIERDGGSDESDHEAAGDLESILGLCLAKKMSERMLRWHYRSKHPSLIAVSNREFYDDKLYIIPSPHSAMRDLGVRFHHVADGVYDRGTSSTNRNEAKAVARAVIEHARTHPKLTLGVGCFSIKQKEAILDELERLWRAETDVQDFFRLDGVEPFFVKNLENVQGDERDVIFISVGYGRDQSGFFSMNLGPLMAEGGERRLNVLITRARRRCEVFSSIHADDIDLGRAKGKGAAAFKTFLAYVETGKFNVGHPTGRDHDLVFEEEVARALRAQGYVVEPQMEIAKFFVDLAVADPNQPGRYILGIECDGAAYHSSRSARDRDRLRQMVLEDHGWVIHRIWSTDWFYRPDDELRKAIAAIERAKIEVLKKDGKVEM